MLPSHPRCSPNDAAGHADFRGEVERVLGMVDGVLVPVDVAEATQLGAFEVECGSGASAVASAWRRAWEHMVPIFTFPPTIWQMTYSTSACDYFPHLVEPTGHGALKLP